MVAFSRRAIAPSSPDCWLKTGAGLSMSSPIGASAQAVIASGLFPLVLQTHGCCPVPNGDLNGLFDFRNLELMASHR
ncbi:MAG: hypothetical protein ACJAX5_001165 [Patiriisocius sp.]|jgi:hypothetical protein